MSSVPYGFSVNGFKLSFRKTKVFLVFIFEFMSKSVCSSSLSRSKWGTFVTPLPKCSSAVANWPLWCPSWCAACCCCCALWVSRALDDECASAVAMDAPDVEEINEIQGSQLPASSLLKAQRHHCSSWWRHHLCVSSLLHTWYNCVCRARVGWAGRGLHFLWAYIFCTHPSQMSTESLFSLLMRYLFIPKS